MPAIQIPKTVRRAIFVLALFLGWAGGATPAAVELIYLRMNNDVFIQIRFVFFCVLHNIMNNHKPSE